MSAQESGGGRSPNHTERPDCALYKPSTAHSSGLICLISQAGQADVPPLGEASCDRLKSVWPMRYLAILPGVAKLTITLGGLCRRQSPTCRAFLACGSTALGSRWLARLHS